jgi:hypothetical protein
MDKERESVLFIGTQFSILYTLVFQSCGLVNYCTIRAIVKIKMVLKVVFGTF